MRAIICVIMNSKIEIDDDYVAQLLVEDARKTSQKYSRQGLSSFLSNRQSAVPKPNMRFLNNIVRQADQHNSALKRKEEAESELRLRALNQYDLPRKKRRIDEDIDHRRSRLFKDIADAAHSTSRSRERKRSSSKKSNERHTRHPCHEQRDSKPDREEEESRERRRRRKHTATSVDRSDDSNAENMAEPKKGERRTKSRHRDEQRMRTGRKLSSESSDPLEDFTSAYTSHPGEPQTRGRGSRGQRSNIDGHFSPNYDPNQDITISSDIEEDDWDMALEALRDRAKWKKNQSARLRSAGFNEQEISSWSHGAFEKDERSLREETDTIKWSQKGEVREWDAGKVLD